MSGDYDYFKNHWESILNALKNDSNMNSLVPPTSIFDNDELLHEHPQNKPSISCPMEKKLPGEYLSGGRQYNWRFPLRIYTAYMVPDASRDQLLKIIGGVTQIFEKPVNQQLGGATSIEVVDLQPSFAVKIENSQSLSRCAQLILVTSNYIPNPI